jgi:hypothetical protein
MMHEMKFSSWERESRNHACAAWKKLEQIQQDFKLQNQ